MNILFKAVVHEQGIPFDLQTGSNINSLKIRQRQ